MDVVQFRFKTGDRVVTPAGGEGVVQGRMVDENGATWSSILHASGLYAWVLERQLQPAPEPVPAGFDPSSIAGD